VLHANGTNIEGNGGDCGLCCYSLPVRAQSRKQKSCVYAGSFDPLTIGHMWMIEQGARLFDRLTVAVGVNPRNDTPFHWKTA